MSVIFDAAAALRIRLNSSAFRADPAAEDMVGYAHAQAVTYVQFESLAAFVTSKFWKARPQAVREFWEFMLLHTANTSELIEEIVKQVRNVQGTGHKPLPTTHSSEMSSLCPRHLSAVFVNC